MPFDQPDDDSKYITEDPAPTLRKVVRGGDKLKGVQPDLLNHWNALQSEFDAAGITPTIKSGYRTAQQQHALYTNPATHSRTKGNDGFTNISPHQEGRALDVGFTASQKTRGHQILADYARRTGLHIPSDEPWHIAIPKSGQAAQPRPADDDAKYITDDAVTDPEDAKYVTAESAAPTPPPDARPALDRITQNTNRLTAYAGLSEGDTKHHFGITADELEKLPTKQRDQILAMSAEAAAEDMRKRQAGQAEFPVDIGYQNTMRRKAGLPPIDASVGALRQREDQLVGQGAVRDVEFGPLRQSDETEVARRQRIASQVAAHHQGPGQYNENAVPGMLDEDTINYKIAEERHTEDKAAEHQARIREIASTFTDRDKAELAAAHQRMSQQGSVNRGIETGSQTVGSGLMYKLAGLVEAVDPRNLATRAVPGSGAVAKALDPLGEIVDRKTLANFLRRQAARGEVSIQQIEAEMPPDRAQRWSKFITQSIGALPEIFAATAAAGPVGGFAALGGLEAQGRGAPLSEVVGETVKGGLIGSAFKFAPLVESPVVEGVEKGVGQRVADIGRSAVPIALGTYGTERAFGANHEDAMQSVVQNLMFHGVARSVDEAHAIIEQALKSPEPEPVGTTVPPETQNRLQAADIARAGGELTSEPGMRPRFRVSDEKLAEMQGVELPTGFREGKPVYAQPPEPPVVEKPVAIAAPPAEDAKYITENRSAATAPPAPETSTENAARMAEAKAKLAAPVAEVGDTVNHSNPDIHGKPIVAKTDDGRVVVPNEANKSGVSVVKPADPAVQKLEDLRRTQQDLATLHEHPARVKGRGFEGIASASVKNYFKRLYDVVARVEPESTHLVNDAEMAWDAGDNAKSIRLSETALAKVHNRYTREVLEAKKLGISNGEIQGLKNENWKAVIEARKRGGEAGFINIGDITAAVTKLFDERRANDHQDVGYELKIPGREPVQIALNIDREGKAILSVGSKASEESNFTSVGPRVDLGTDTILALKHYLLAQHPDIKRVIATRVGSTGGEFGRFVDLDVRPRGERRGERGAVNVGDIAQALADLRAKFPDKSDDELRTMLGPAQKERSLPKTLAESGREPGTNLTYEQLPNPKTLAKVTDRLAKEGADALELWYRDAPASAERSATHQVLVDHLQTESVKAVNPDYAAALRARAVDLSNLEVERATIAGQAVQAYSMLNKYTPAGVALEIAKAKGKGVKVGDADAESATEAAVEHQKADKEVEKRRKKVEDLEAAVEEGKGPGKGKDEYESVVSAVYRRRTPKERPTDIRTLQGVLKDLAPTEQLREAAERMIGDTDLSRWMRETKAKYNMSAEDATKLGQQAHALLKKARAESANESKMARLRKKYPDASTDELVLARQQLDDALARRRAAKTEMARFFDKLSQKQQGYYRRSMNITRAMMVSAFSTAMRNAQSQAGAVGAVRVADVIEHVIRKSVGLESDFTFRSIGRNALRVFRPSDKLAREIAGEHPAELARLFNNYAGGVEVPQLEHGPIANKIHRSVERLFGGMEKAAKVVNFANQLQEFHLRSAEFLSELDLHIRKDHDMTLEKFVARYGADAIPKEFITKAVDKALEVTFAASPGREGLGGRLLGDLIEVGNYIPPTVSPIAFPKFMFSSLKFLYQYNPTGMIDLARSGQNKPRVIAKALLGSTMLLTAYQFRKSEYAGEKWYELKLGGHTFDTRPFGPFSTYLFLGEALRRAQAGEPHFTLAEIAEAIGASSGPGGTGIAVAEKLYNYSMQGQWDKFQRVLKTEAGDFGRALLTPVRQLKDLVAAFDPAEGFTRDTSEQPLVGAIKESIPGLSRDLPVAGRPTSATPIHQEHPAIKALTGWRVETPKTYLEQQLDALHFDPSEVRPATGLPKIDEFEKRAMGPLMDQLSNELENDPDFKALGPAQRADIIKDHITDIRNEVRDMGKSEMPDEYERLKEERKPARKKALEEELNSPGLSKAMKLGVPMGVPVRQPNETDIAYRARLLQTGRARRSTLDTVASSDGFHSAPAHEQRKQLHSALA